MFTRLSLSAFIALLLAATPLSVALHAHAGEIADLGTQADEQLAAGDADAALKALDKAYDIAWTASPLTIRKALFIDEATGYGLYVERESDVFAPGEPMKIYAEPVGFGYGRNAVGASQIGFDVDFVLTDTEGKELFAREKFMSVATPVRYRNREFHLTLTLNLTGLGDGAYVAKLKLIDQNSDKTSDLEMPFTVKSQ